MSSSPGSGNRGDGAAATDSGDKKTYEPDPKPASKPKKGKRK